VAHNEHPHLSYSDNAKFRAVHDWHHIIGGADDSMKGEILTYFIARESAPVATHWLLFSEIILQAATATHTGKFAPQKLVKV
jgi:ubiquinone biosynthesis protein Coq4